MSTMKAVIFNKPFDISVEDRPIPEILAPTDAIVKVKYTALCGSELHVFRGHQPSPTNFIMGHEFTGTVHKVGSEIKSLKPGDSIVAPFTVSCGNNCFYCKHGASSRCKNSLLFGTKALDGAQAEYVRVPLADSTLVLQPSLFSSSPESEKKLVLMADIFPTGYFAAKNIFQDIHPEAVYDTTDGPFVAVVVGCGPVGLCGIVAATVLAPKGAKIYAVDTVPERLKEAEKLGATPLLLPTDGTAITDEKHPVSIIKSVTGGRGADGVMEIVGHSDALRLAFDLLRPWGKISSVGVHNADIPITGNEAYGKNVTIQFGRCPVRSIFDESLNVFANNIDKLNILTGHIMKLEDAKEAYDLFDKRKVQKVIFEI